MQQYLDLLKRNRNYRYLWWGNVVSLLGDWFNLIASAEIITEISNSGVAISYLFLARFLPLFFFSPLAGVIADRYDRKKILVVTDVLRALTVLGFLLVAVTGYVWLLYLLTVMQFALSALFTPARSAVLANVVDEKDLVTANALDSFTWSTMLAVGALLGGVVASLFGANTAFVLDAFTYLLSGVLLMQIVMPKRDIVEQGSQSSGWFDFVEGFRYLWSRPFLLGSWFGKSWWLFGLGCHQCFRNSVCRRNFFPFAGEFCPQFGDCRWGNGNLGTDLFGKWVGYRVGTLVYAPHFGRFNTTNDGGD